MAAHITIHFRSDHELVSVVVIEPVTDPALGTPLVWPTVRIRGIDEIDPVSVRCVKQILGLFVTDHRLRQ